MESDFRRTGCQPTLRSELTSNGFQIGLTDLLCDTITSCTLYQRNHLIDMKNPHQTTSVRKLILNEYVRMWQINGTIWSFAKRPHFSKLYPKGTVLVPLFFECAFFLWHFKQFWAKNFFFLFWSQVPTM